MNNEPRNRNDGYFIARVWDKAFIKIIELIISMRKKAIHKLINRDNPLRDNFMTKQFELLIEQVDAIMINQLQEVVEMNWCEDHGIVDAAFKLLAYYMPHDDYSKYREQLKETPPRGIFAGQSDV